MKINKDLDFLDCCIDFLDQLENVEIEKLRLIYKEEMEKKSEKTEFEIMLPEDISTFSFDYIPAEKKYDLDYKIPFCGESVADSLNCIAA